MNKQTIFALGFFDGVHLGHQALLRTCCCLAQQHDMNAGAVTFSAHPDALVFGAPPVLINTPADREKLLREYVSRVVTLPFDKKMQCTPWQDFLDALCTHCDAGGFVCGDDFCFGSRGEGNAEHLSHYCRERGLVCTVVPEQTVDGIRVSSTYIRTLLEQGDMERANRFLGHAHILSGMVIHGQGLGRTIGIPTANLAYPDGLAELKHGVYAAKLSLDGKAYMAVVNIGMRPTVSGENLNAECWILDYFGDLYGREITLEIYRFLRPERKFDSLQQMQAEIQKDALRARACFAEA